MHQKLDRMVSKGKKMIPFIEKEFSLPYGTFDYEPGADDGEAPAVYGVSEDGWNEDYQNNPY